MGNQVGKNEDIVYSEVDGVPTSTSKIVTTRPNGAALENPAPGVRIVVVRGDSKTLGTDAAMVAFANNLSELLSRVLRLFMVVHLLYGVIDLAMDPPQVVDTCFTRRVVLTAVLLLQDIGWCALWAYEVWAPILPDISVSDQGERERLRIKQREEHARYFSTVHVRNLVWLVTFFWAGILFVASSCANLYCHLLPLATIAFFTGQIAIACAICCLV
jgi:hypothetical protein